MIIQKKMIRKRLNITRLFFPLLLVLTACLPHEGSSEGKSEFVIGTLCTINLFEDGRPALYDRLFNRLAELEIILSANRDDSVLARVNRNAGLQAVEIPGELYAVLERALYFAEATGGAFDPTIGPLVKLWGIGTESARIPSGREIDTALALVNYRELELNGNTAFLKNRGMALDLGAIAKGYAADELVKILREEGVTRALLDLGGNVYVWGKKENGTPWRIGVQDPLAPRGTYLGILELEGSISVVCSGVYERFFTGEDGRRYHHILELREQGESRRGYPTMNGVLSTTIIAASSMDADALSTSCFILGYEKGATLAAANGAEVLFMEESGIRGSTGAMTVFSLKE